MILVEIGHTSGLDVESVEGVEKVVPMEGQRVTTIRIPDGEDALSAYAAILNLMPHHMTVGETPAWIESSDTALKKLLVSHYGVTIKSNRRPAGWGQE